MTNPERAPIGLLAVVCTLLGRAELVGSRGRARKYGQPDPKEADWDWAIFTDDPDELVEVHRKLVCLGEDYSFELHPRDDGTLTASGWGMDISTHPLWKQDWIPWVWYWEEQGKPKEVAYALARMTLEYGWDELVVPPVDQV